MAGKLGVGRAGVLAARGSLRKSFHGVLALAAGEEAAARGNTIGHVQRVVAAVGEDGQVLLGHLLRRRLLLVLLLLLLLRSPVLVQLLRKLDGGELGVLLRVSRAVVGVVAHAPVRGALLLELSVARVAEGLVGLELEDLRFLLLAVLANNAAQSLLGKGNRRLWILFRSGERELSLHAAAEELGSHDWSRRSFLFSARKARRECSPVKRRTGERPALTTRAGDTMRATTGSFDGDSRASLAVSSRACRVWVSLSLSLCACVRARDVLVFFLVLVSRATLLFVQPSFRLPLLSFLCGSDGVGRS